MSNNTAPETLSRKRTRFCPLCEGEITTRHLVKVEWLDILRFHCRDRASFDQIVAGKTEICCSHFHAHSHTSKKASNLILLTEYCRPGYLISSSSHQPSFKPTPQKKPKTNTQTDFKQLSHPIHHQPSYLRDTMTRDSTRRQTLSSLTDGFHSEISDWKLHLKNSHLPLSSLEIALEGISEDIDTVPVAQVQELLTLILTKHREEKKLSFFNFTHLRSDLFFWTGIRDISVIESFFIRPLLTHYSSSVSDRRRLPKSLTGTPDRVILLLMWLWGTFSLNQFQTLLKETGTYEKGDRSLAKLLKKTASDLADIFRPQISLPTIQDWIEHSDPQLIEGMDSYPLQLMIIIDGTSLPILKPENEKLQSQMWVDYKNHHAWRYMIGCLPSGLIVFLSELAEGKCLDSDLYVRSGLKNLAEGIPLDDSWRYTLVGDKGYIYIVPPDGWELLLTKSGEAELRQSLDGQTSKPANGDPGASSRFLRRFETPIAKVRSVVERSISVIKRWPRLSVECHQCFKHGEKFLTDLTTIAAAFANLQIREAISKRRAKISSPSIESPSELSDSVDPDALENDGL